MKIEIEALEARVLGAFIEKDLATPEHYPLSLNALTNACNQKSNRYPVLQLPEAEILAAVELLRNKGLAMQSQNAGSRVNKFRHTLRERLYLEDQELAILAELLLRGPQTPGELRSRADRMAGFKDLPQVDDNLQELIDKEPPMVIKLARQAGRKEHRYMHLLCGPVAETDQSLAEPPGMSNTANPTAELETEVTLIKAELAALRLEFEEFRKQFE